MIRAITLRVLTTMVSGLLLTACSGGRIDNFFLGKTNQPQPTPLTEIRSQVSAKVAWKTKIGAGFGGRFSRFTLSPNGNMLIAATAEGSVAAVDMHSGNVSWRKKVGSALSAGAGGGDGLAFVGTTKGDLIALNASNGEEKWRVQLTAPVASAPQAARGITVARLKDERIMAFASANGERGWVHAGLNRPMLLRGSNIPLISGDVVISAMDDGEMVILGLASGQMLWGEHVINPQGADDISRMTDLDARPLSRDGVVYLGAYRGSVLAIHMEKMQLLWHKPIKTYAGFAINPELLFVVEDDSHIQALRRDSGETLWRSASLVGRSLTMPILIGNVIMVGDHEGYVHLLSASDGSLIGRTRISNSALLPDVLEINSRVFFLTEDGQLIAVDPAEAS